MKNISPILKALALAALAVFLAGGCSRNSDAPDTDGGATLRISVKKAEYSTRTSFLAGDDDTIEKLLVLFYSEKEALVGWKYSAGTVTDGDTMPVDSLVDGCRYYIYALSGIEMPEDIFDTFGSIGKAEDFFWDKAQLSTIDKTPFAYVPVGPVMMEDGGEYTISLERVLAKINFMVDCSRLEGSYEIKSLDIRQSPYMTRPLCKGNAAESPADVEDGDTASHQDIVTLNEGGRVSYYLMENLQGYAVPGNSDPWSKIPQNMAADKGSLATYVEIRGDYRNNGIYIRDLTYRFFLGEDTVNNCDVRRNTIQTVTLILSDSNAMVTENWKITRGDVDDSRSISADTDTVHVFPYPGREDIISLDLTPADLSYTAELLCDNPSAAPFSIQNNSDEVVIRSEKYLPEGSTATEYPLCISTLDKLHSTTVTIVYHPLDRIDIAVPFELYSNFEGRVRDIATYETITLHNSTARDRSAGADCLNFIFDYGGIIKTTMGNGVAGRDTVFERGLSLTSSDEAIVSSGISDTNPTLWYVQANSAGNAGIMAIVHMGDTFVEGFCNVNTHALGLTLNADSPIEIGESCNPWVQLANESGDSFLAYPGSLGYSSQKRNIVSDEGNGISEGKSVYTASYAGNGSFSLTDSREISVLGKDAGNEESWQLIIAPSASQTLCVGESSVETAYLIHYVDGAEASREAVSCSWSVSDASTVTLSGNSGASTTVTGIRASAGPVVLNATHNAANGNTYKAKANIYVSSPAFYIDRQSLVWLANEKEAGCARIININASPALSWTAVLSGQDYNYFALSQTSGTGPGSIAVYPTTENANRNNDRTATLTLSANGTQDQTVSLRHRRDSLLKLNIVPHEVTLDLNSETNKADTLLRLTTDWLSGRTGVSIPNSYAEWSSSAPEVAASEGYGKVQAYGPGRAAITATWRSMSDTARINVINTGSYDTTYIVRIKPDTDQSIGYNGTIQFNASAQMLVNGRFIGGAFDVTPTSSWLSTVPEAASVHSGLATGCNTGMSPLSTLICATYKGYDSNYVTLNVGCRSGDIKSIRLDIRSLTTNENGHITVWKNGYISEAAFHHGDNTYNNGEESVWGTVHGGSFNDMTATIEVALYATMYSGGSEQLLDVRTFSFSVMRGDDIDFTPSDWPDIFNTDYFTFKATIKVD